MKLKTNHSFLLDILLGVITFGIWNLIVLKRNLEEGKQIGDRSFTFNPTLVIILILIPATSFVGSIMALIYKIQVIGDRINLLNENGIKPPTTLLRIILSYVFGIFTLGIWPLVEKILSYKLWNKANELYNQTHGF